MSLDKIKQKLQEINDAKEKQGKKDFAESALWNPQPGKQQIRIVPYKHAEDPDYPFTELYIYYKTFGKQWLVSPASFGGFDPVIEYCHSLNPKVKLPKDEWQNIKNIQDKLMPVKQYFLPILVRDKEHEGVKFWKFSNKIFTQLLSIMGDDDWGRIFDLKEGRDIIVEYTPGDEASKTPANTQMFPKPNKTAATDNSVVLEKIENMPKVEDQFKLVTAEELRVKLDEYLSIDYDPKNVKANTANVHSGFEVEKREKPKVDIDSDLDDLFNSLPKK